MRIILDTDNEQNFVDLWNPEKNNWERYIKCEKKEETKKAKNKSLNEEDKKIGKIETYDIIGEVFIDDCSFKYVPIDKHCLTANEQVFVEKINEMIKAINEMREDK